MVTGNLRLCDPFFKGRTQHGKAFEGLPPLCLRVGCELYRLFCHDECDILASKGPTAPSLSSIPATSDNCTEITSLNFWIYILFSLCCSIPHLFGDVDFDGGVVM